MGHATDDDVRAGPAVRSLIALCCCTPQARDRKSGTVVALKLYRLHKLNDISNHQVAREVSSQAQLS